MSTEPSNIRIVRGEDRYKGSPNEDTFLQVGLEGDRRVMVEGDRTVLINAAEQFDKERQESDVIRMSGKIINISNNVYSGKTTYDPFKNSLYYINGAQSKITGVWTGYPQFDEFTFFRTTSVAGHIDFVPRSAFTYNWTMYVTYPYSSDTTQVMRYENEDFSSVVNFTVSDGIPFVIQNRISNGKKLITFYCGMLHNLRDGEYVELSFNYNGRKHFQVFTLGDEYFGNDGKIFNLLDLGYTGTTFANGVTGTLKRVIDLTNTGETTSQYYVRKNKVLTNVGDYNLTKLGFESNPFRDVKKLEYSALTPNNVERISIKDGSRSFGFVFEKDIDISGLKDNLGRPLTTLSTTIINKGYMGWFHKPYSNTYPAINVGWEFNYLRNTVDPWWSNSSSTNKDQTLKTNYYNVNNNTFYYTDDLKVGDVVKGDVCEWNEYEMEETVISRMLHRFHFNPMVFQDNSTIDLPTGYMYYPHKDVKVRDFSSYIEEGDKNNVENIPYWSIYSNSEKKWRWRDLYPYGYVDSSGYGVDHPFMNGAHYPFNDIMFLQFPQNKQFRPQVIADPIIDDCE